MQAGQEQQVAQLQLVKLCEYIIMCRSTLLDPCMAWHKLWRSALINQAISAAAQHYRSFHDRFALTPQIRKRFERVSKRNETN
jgi:hypothetical protein